MLEILVLVFLGVLAGVLTGLIPGLHPNTVIFSSLPFYFELGISFRIYASFIAGLSVSHTFHDFIPSIFLGVPEPDSALAALPGQKMAMRGRGPEAFIQTVYGGLYAILLSLPSSVLFYFFLEGVYSFLEPLMHFILIFFLLTILFHSDRKFSSFLVGTLSGVLGLLSFRAPVNQQYVLIPVFGGLFAFPSVWNSLQSSGDLPPQSLSAGRDPSWSGGFLGFFASIPVALFPGTTNSIATTFLWPAVDSRRKFLSAVGGANTSDIFLSFLTLMLIQRARSGAAVAVQTLGRGGSALFLIGASILAVSLSAPVSLAVLKTYVGSGLASKQKPLGLAAISTIVGFSFFLTGLIGLTIFLTSSAIGFLAALTGNRHSCMAVLLAPSIIFFAPPGFI